MIGHGKRNGNQSVLFYNLKDTFMKNSTIFFASTLFLLSLTTQGILGSASVPYARNRQDFLDITNGIKDHIKTTTLNEQPQPRNAQIIIQGKITDFDRDNHTVVYYATLTSHVTHSVNGKDIMHSHELSYCNPTICVSEKLFKELKSEQSWCTTS